MSFGGLMNQVPEIPANDVVGLDAFVDAKTEALYNRIMNEIQNKNYLSPIRQRYFYNNNFSIINVNDIINFSTLSLNFVGLNLNINSYNSDDIIYIRGRVNTERIKVLGYSGSNKTSIYIPSLTVTLHSGYYQLDKDYSGNSKLLLYGNNSYVQVECSSGRANDNITVYADSRASFNYCIATYYP